MEENKTFNKILQITNDNYVFSGNRKHDNKKLDKDFHHIEEYFFNKFLIDSFFNKEIYYELLKIENKFRYLREFLVQLEWVVLVKVMERISNRENILEIIKNIENDTPDSLRPIELQFSYLIIADYLDYFIKEKSTSFIKSKIPLEQLSRELKAIFKREIINFPVRVEFSTDYVQTPTNDPGANGKWWVYPKSETLKKIEIETEIDNNIPIPKKLKWNGSNIQLYDVIRQLKKKDLIVNSYVEIAGLICQNFEGFESNYSTVLKEIQREQKPPKNKRIDLDLSELPETDKILPE